jgi:small multidrug resistance pump
LGYRLTNCHQAFTQFRCSILTLQPSRRENAVPWIFLTVAILFEVAGITSMKLSRGLTETGPSIAVVVFYVCSAAAVILAMKKLELSTAYAIWSGVGTALAAAIGVAYFREPMTLLKIGSLALVILGVVGLSIAGRETN